MSPIEIAGMDQLLARAEQLVDRGGSGRRLLGIVGAPGAGKSTVSEALLAALGADAALLPMDGFHLANEQLDRLGRRHRKGAPDTFDALGYTAALRRLRDGEAVYAPRFDRELDAGVAGAIHLAAEVPLILTEGNYLLLEEGGWEGVAPLLDELWYIDVDDELRRERLVARHMRFGRTEAEARAWAWEVDEPNAVRIAQCRDRAHVVVRLDEEPSTSEDPASSPSPRIRASDRTTPGEETP